MRLFTPPSHPLVGKSQILKCCKKDFQKEIFFFLCNERYAAPLQEWPINFIVSTLFMFIEKFWTVEQNIFFFYQMEKNLDNVYNPNKKTIVKKKIYFQLYPKKWRTKKRCAKKTKNSCLNQKVPKVAKTKKRCAMLWNAFKF